MTPQPVTLITTLLLIFLSIPILAQESGEKQKRKGPPPEAFAACEGKVIGDTAEFTSPRGHVVTGTCEQEKDGDRVVLRPDKRRKKKKNKNKDQ